MPDEKVSLYPPVLSEGAASLLPDADKPAIVLRSASRATARYRLDGVDVRSSGAGQSSATRRSSRRTCPRASLSCRAESSRGAGARRRRVDPPQQQVVRGGWRLRSIPADESGRTTNAALSLAANLAIADLLYQHGTGLFRVMPEPDDRAVRRLRHSAEALGVEWPKTMSSRSVERSLDPNDPKQAAFMLAIRRAGASREL